MNRMKMIVGSMLQGAGIVLIAAGARLQGQVGIGDIPPDIMAAFDKLGEQIVEQAEFEIDDARQRRMRGDDRDISASLDRQSDYFQEREDQPWEARD